MVQVRVSRAMPPQPPQPHPSRVHPLPRAPRWPHPPLKMDAQPLPHRAPQMARERVTPGQVTVLRRQEAPHQNQRHKDQEYKDQEYKDQEYKDQEHMGWWAHWWSMQRRL